MTELDDDTAAALAGVEVTEVYEGQGGDRKLVGYTHKIKWADKGQNLERLGRYFKMFTDRVSLETPLEDLVCGIAEKGSATAKV